VSRTKLIRLAGAATGAIIAAGALVSAVSSAYNSSFATGGGSSFSWYLPLLVGTAIAGLAWAMLAGRPVDRDSDVGLGVDSCCTACGGAIHSDWRLCPHCGERLPGVDRA